MRRKWEARFYKKGVGMRDQDPPPFQTLIIQHRMNGSVTAPGVDECGLVTIGFELVFEESGKMTTGRLLAAIVGLIMSSSSGKAVIKGPLDVAEETNWK